MGRVFLYANSIDPRSNIFLELSNFNFEKILTLSPHTYNSKQFLNRKLPIWSKLSWKLSKGNLLNPIIDSNQFLGISQFYFAFRSRIASSQPTKVESDLIKWFQVKKLNRLLKIVDFAVISADFDISKIRIPPNTKVFLEVRWHHKAQNIVRGETVLDYPHKLKTELAGAWEVVFDVNKFKFLGLITYSDMALNSFIETGFPVNQIYKVPIPTIRHYEIEFIPKKRIPGSLLYIGRHQPSKGLDLAVAVAMSLGHELTVVGNFSPEVVDWLNNKTNIKFLGRQNHSKVRELMLQLEVCLIPSVESFGFVACEALEGGMKIVLSPWCGLKSWIEGNPNIFEAEDLRLESLTKSTLVALSTDHAPTELRISNGQQHWNKILTDITNQ
jgi:glycosyltransferase involved in cell wall biosynthesis